MKGLGLASRIYAIVALSLLVGAGASMFMVRELSTVSGHYDDIIGQEVQAGKASDAARVLQVTFKKQVQAWKDILLRGADAESLQKYSAEFRAAGESVDQMASHLSQADSDQTTGALIQDFLSAHQELGRAYDAALQVFLAGKGQDPRPADGMVKGKDRRPTDLIDQLVAKATARQADRRGAEQAVVARIQWIAALGLLFGFGCVIAVCVWQARRVIRSLKVEIVGLGSGATQTLVAAGQVAAAAQGLSQGATEQAAALEETSASMEELSSMTRKNAEGADKVAALVGDIEQRVSVSQEMLRSMVSSMGAITESSRKVSKIIKTIDEIAFQTNILALNAAVEAARAGEAGMGFAVVADEVRNLAQRAAQAARDTTGLIDEAGASADQGSARVEQVAASIASFTEQVTQVRNIAQQVQASSREQAQGFEQVSRAIAQMEQVTQSTAATAEESAAASEELNAQVETSRAQIGALETLLGGVRQADTGGGPAGPTGASAPAAVGPRAWSGARTIGVARSQDATRRAA